MSLLLWKAVLSYSYAKALVTQKTGSVSVAGADMQIQILHSPFQTSCIIQHPQCSQPFLTGEVPSAPRLPLLLKEAEPPKLLVLRHFQAHDGEARFSSEKEGEETTAKEDEQAPQPSSPSAAYRIRNLPNIYRKQVTSMWE